ncbi:hypothetical protein [Mucilaginibacter gracilis]|nr:hypothetical protein [Mucilaginibacter gracilis]
MHITDVKYYGICLKFQFQSIYIIWILDEVDTVLLDEQSKIIGFKTVDELHVFLEKNNMQLTDEVSCVDVGKVQRWIVSPNKNIDYLTFLDTWNLFIDISESLNIAYLGDKKGAVRNSVYNKLFDRAGPFITQDSSAIFNEKEIVVLAKIMENGFDLLLNNLSITVKPVLP